MIINKININNCQEKYQWKGSGVKDDPIVIDYIEDPNEILWLKEIDVYVVLRNLTIKRINIDNSKNIIIENCQIFEFYIQACINFIIKNNLIHDLVLYEIKSCVIKENKVGMPIREVEANYFSKIGDKVIFFSAILFFSLALIFFIHGIWSNILFQDHELTSILIGLFISSIIYLIIVYLRRHLRKNVDKLPSNIFKDNELINLDDQFKIFLDD